MRYRHVINSLVRKPGAFANYAYRDDLPPATRCRIAYDRFCEDRDECRSCGLKSPGGAANRLLVC